MRSLAVRKLRHGIASYVVNPTLRQAFVTNLVNLAGDHDLDGVDIEG